MIAKSGLPSLLQKGKLMSKAARDGVSKAARDVVSMALNAQ